MALNEDLEWGSLGDQVQKAFTDGIEPTKDLLPVGMRLYRFHDDWMLIDPRDRQQRVPRWWSNLEPYKLEAAFTQRIKTAQDKGCSLRQVVREESAISEDWNSLKYQMTGTLAVPVYGWVGPAAAQPRLTPGTDSKVAPGEGKGQSATLAGGATQFFIPNLKAEHFSDWSSIPRLRS